MRCAALILSVTAMVGSTYSQTGDFYIIDFGRNGYLEPNIAEFWIYDREYPDLVGSLRIEDPTAEHESMWSFQEYEAETPHHQWRQVGSSFALPVDVSIVDDVMHASFDWTLGNGLWTVFPLTPTANGEPLEISIDYFNTHKMFVNVPEPGCMVLLSTLVGCLTWRRWRCQSFPAS